MKRLSGPEFIDVLVDGRSFASWDSAIAESITTGRATIGGAPVALMVSEFGFLGGSIGIAAARRIEDGLRRATRERLPVIAASSSGGVRMQEGTPAFVELVGITRAVLAHKAAGLPYLVYLRNPTTGGVFASWASLGQVTWAEPGALIGFLGPRVFEALRGSEFPTGVQRAENLVAHGVIDAVVGINELTVRMSALLRLLVPRPERRNSFEPVTSAPAERQPVWDSVLASRHPDRPGVRELLDHAADDVIPLSGTGAGEIDASVLLALTSLDGEPCVLIGHDRRYPVTPAGLRGARRGMRLAQELRLPLVAVIDTGGADLSPQAEEGALAGEIARCVADFASLTVPSVSVLLGEGAGGAALALLPARQVIAAEHAWLAPLPPEGAAALVYRDIGHAPDMAEQQHIGAWELLARGIVRHVVAEPIPAHRDAVRFVRRVARDCAHCIRAQLTDA
ncbi:MAG TPA: carboxyl transferase domain-containing protein, partial [Pseudonocardiaceae bacterium]